MEELDLKELLTLFWNKKVKILLIVAIFMLIGVIYTVGFVTPMYTSSTTLVLANTASDKITTSDITLNSNLVATYSELAKSKKVVTKVISNLGIDVDVEKVRKNITVTSRKNTEVIEISVSNEYATNAAKIANEIAKVFSEEVADIYNINNIHVVDKAEVDDIPSNVNHLKDIIMFIFIGLVAAMLYVIILNMLDTTIKTAEEVEKQFKIPVLVSIPLYSFDVEKAKGGRKK